MNPNYRKRRIILLITLAVVVLVCALLFPRDRHAAQLLACRNYVSAIGMAARLWADDHDGRFPADLLTMSNELISPKILVCPGDKSRKPAASWDTFTPAQSSFEVVTPGVVFGESNRVFLRCTVHGTLGYADGSIGSQSR